MIEILLDASQLDTYQPCPRKWYYSNQLDLVPLRSKSAFDKGTYYHACLEHFYKLPLQGVNDYDERMKSTIDFASRSDLLKSCKITDIEEIRFHRARLNHYMIYWEHEDDSLKPIAVEGGFSYLLYEDNLRRYILEGKIDLISHSRPYGLAVTDHKTQSRYDDKWPMNNQVMNYLNFMRRAGPGEADYFVYNYIGLQDKLPKNGFRRQIYRPHPGMLDQWESEVKETFDSLYRFKVLQERLPEVKLLPARFRSACDGKYGLCSYFKLCSIPDGSKWEPAILGAYKVKDEKWRAWT